MISAADEDEVFGLGQELQFGQGVDLFAADCGLAGEGEAGQRPALGQAGLADAPGQRGFLPVVPLGSQQPGNKLGVGDVLLLGGA